MEKPKVELDTLAAPPPIPTLNVPDLSSMSEEATKTDVIAAKAKHFYPEEETVSNITSKNSSQVRYIHFYPFLYV